MAVKIDTILPTEKDIQLARTSRVQLAKMVSPDGSAHLSVHKSDTEDIELCLPQLAVKLLLDALTEFGQGNGLTVTPVMKEMTTQQAADFLMVSRPFLITEILEKGKVPYRMVGNRRRIRYADLKLYQQWEEQEIDRREQVMLELIAETQRLGLYE